MRLVDSHAHLQADAFAPDRDSVVAAARAAGVSRILIPGWDVETSRSAVAMADASAFVFAGAGIHPHVASRIDGTGWAEIARLAAGPRVVAVGETGLDYDRAFSSRDDQLANLERHIELALDLAKPLILHCRSRPGEHDAQDDLLRFLESGGIGTAEAEASFHGRPRAVLHSFSGPVAHGERALALGCAVSFSGLVFRRGEDATAEVARVVPDDRLLVETDCPWLSPPGAPRRRNEPRWVEVTARWLAEQRAMDPEALGDQLVANFDSIFGV
jgi:TatD DNase family protein